MQLRSIFEKDVDRKIEGVIKADDAQNLLQEIEEYVLTEEVKKRLSSFLDTYCDGGTTNGAWISGFFGSGKSHLLKMLAMLLENKRIGEKNALELFLPKCGDDELLRADLKKAASIPSRSILFNIDQKADLTQKEQEDALLGVFVKVFNEASGYYGKQPYIARFERHLDERGLFEAFQNAYQGVAGKPWETGREQVFFEGEHVARACSQVGLPLEENGKPILDRYREDYHLSIEDFAQMVKKTLDKSPPSFRINFFVDEVGQFIAGNTRLMTNLQTIAESLATICGGKAWILVTAQDAMDTLVGEMDMRKGNDFSKIQDRFTQRMKLTSANVEEVIQKRLLLKNEQGIDLLSDQYHLQSNNFRTLFRFSDDSFQYAPFRDREHFIHSYPFLPYQYDLFQSAIQNLSAHNAFEGKHSSVGERSMLGVFQEVAKQLLHQEVGKLAGFDRMFDGIRNVLKSTLQRSIVQAEKNLETPLDVRLLKALFLVKYVKEFKPNVQNLSVLMLEEFDTDVLTLKKNVEESLHRLENQTYIQRNGETFEFLTDQEKDVEQEIKNSEVESSDVESELEGLFFDHVLQDRKIRYDPTRQDFNFCRKIDGKTRGREQELAIHLVTPFNERVESTASLVLESLGKNELLVVLPPDDVLVRELTLFKKTQKFLQLHVGSTENESIQAILESKGRQNNLRKDELQELVETLVQQASLFARGKEIQQNKGKGKERISGAFQQLVMLSYPNLPLLQNRSFAEKDIAGYLKDGQRKLDGTDASPLGAAEKEILDTLRLDQSSGTRTTLKSLVEKFEKIPYGWPPSAVLCLSAGLFAQGKLEVHFDGTELEAAQIESKFQNSRLRENIILRPQETYSPSQVRALKEFFSQFFDRPPHQTDPKPLARETLESLGKMRKELQNTQEQCAPYPFRKVLTPLLQALEKLETKPVGFFLNDFAETAEELLEQKETLVDPLLHFLQGGQKQLFDRAAKFLKKWEPNASYLEEEDWQQVSRTLQDATCFLGSAMQQITAPLEKLQRQLKRVQEEAREQARQSLAALQEKLHELDDFARASQQVQQELAQAFRQASESIDSQPYIANIQQIPQRFESTTYPKLLEKLVDAYPANPAGEPQGDNPTVQEPSKVDKPVQAFKSLSIPFSKPWLIDEQDVDSYLQLLKQRLLEEIQQGKKIQL